MTTGKSLVNFVVVALSSVALGEIAELASVYQGAKMGNVGSKGLLV